MYPIFWILCHVEIIFLGKIIKKLQEFHHPALPAGRQAGSPDSLRSSVSAPLLDRRGAETICK